MKVWIIQRIIKDQQKRSEFYLFDDNWTEFKKLIDKVNKVYEELA